MSNLDPQALARTIIDDRIREATRMRQARELRRREHPSTERTATRSLRRHSRLWSLVHLRRAYS